MFVFVSDLFVFDYVGGAELTTQAIMESQKAPIVAVRSSQLTKENIEYFKDRHWIFGNFAGLSTEIILECYKKLTYSVIEYDYKYCSYRLPEKHILDKEECQCEDSARGKMISVFLEKAKTLWFMSENQMIKYCETFPFLKKETTRVLSSVFSTVTLDQIEKMKTNEKDDTWIIQKSDSWVKGTADSIEYAKKNNLKYEIFSGLSYGDMLLKFSNSKGFIFLPKGSDTCPRTVIEAKLLGCELILNDNVQHKEEKWFSGSVDDTVEYLRGRTSYFWQEVTKASNIRLPKKPSTQSENIHFKIIIPVYNSEKWILQTIDSIKEQEYSNYECIISDDMSTDSTLHNALDKSPLEFEIVSNKEKKYALKNIYDSIVSLNPSPDDVIIILDGDDWLSNEYVLSSLNEYYTNEKCLLTYGSFVQFPNGVIGQEASEYPPEVIYNNSYREDQWRASHLKTFKHSLWQKVKEEDLKNVDGKFYENSYDQAMMLPMLEMAGNRAKYIPEVLCVYNTGNPLAVNKTKAEMQHRYMLEIRKKQPYKRMADEDLSGEH